MMEPSVQEKKGRVKGPPGEEEVELAVGWVSGEVTMRQVERALGCAHGSAYVLMARGLAEYVRQEWAKTG